MVRTYIIGCCGAGLTSAITTALAAQDHSILVVNSINDVEPITLHYYAQDLINKISLIHAEFIPLVESHEHLSRFTIGKSKPASPRNDKERDYG